ncbi:MAG: TetR/AcrR family transcriptional regulator [Spirochaetes bacterium]|jgi:AcrR family transcriptional regulator|nr:TetR/AcrR family transcriptional regulator [Spirochaetota bacterium]
MKPEERKNRILDCAKRLFSKNGYHNTQISDIISEAGIARGTIYQYFQNKEDLFSSLLDSLYRGLEGSIIISPEEVKKYMARPGSYLGYRIKRTLEYFYSDRDLCSIVLRITQGLQPEFGHLIRRFENKLMELLKGDIELGKKHSTVRKDIDTELTANLIAGALFRISYNYFLSDNPRHGRVDIDEITEKIVSIFMKGLFLETS